MAHRQICLKLQTATGKFGTAELRCSSVSSSVLELHFMQEVAEIITLLSSKFAFYSKQFYLKGS